MPPGGQITSDSDLESVLQDYKLRQTRRDSSGPKYTCSIVGCDAIFKRLDHLDRHEYQHTGIKRHACSYDDCDKIYTIVTHLKRHLRTTHERPDLPPQKNIKCTVLECSKLFTSASNMQRHVREAHENPREYPCAHCAARFTQKIKLRRHEVSQHTHNYPYKCGKCSRGFFQQWQQESHERSCKLYACSNCSLKFDKWTLYIRHCRETQHERNRHKCIHCERSYDKPSELSKHVAAKHAEDNGADVPFTCTEPGCTRTYAYERNLRQHVLTAHAGRRFECLDVDCGRCFSSAQNLAKHLARDHEASDQDTETTTAAAPKKTTPSKAKRKRRKDAGRTVRSRLSQLAGLTLDKQLDDQVRARKILALDNVAKSLETTQPFEDEADIKDMLAQVLEDEAT